MHRDALAEHAPRHTGRACARLTIYRNLGAPLLDEAFYISPHLLLSPCISPCISPVSPQARPSLTRPSRGGTAPSSPTARPEPLPLSLSLSLSLPLRRSLPLTQTLTIFAYGQVSIPKPTPKPTPGQTGSGKSFSMTGSQDQPGIIRRMNEEMFAKIAATQA